MAKGKVYREKVLITPIFTLFFYSHNPTQYESLRNKLREQLMKHWRYNSEFKTFYKQNKALAEANIIKAQEEKYPTPLYYNDIAGFISIKLENPIENFRIIADVWSIENRRFKTKKVFIRSYGVTETIIKKLLNDEKKFNEEFFSKLEKLLKKISNEFVRKKRFYFPVKENRVHWSFIKHSNIAAFLKELGTNWSY